MRREGHPDSLEILSHLTATFRAVPGDGSGHGLSLDMGADQENRNWELMNRSRKVWVGKFLFLPQYEPGQVCAPTHTWQVFE